MTRHLFGIEHLFCMGFPRDINNNKICRIVNVRHTAINQLTSISAAC